MESHWIGIPQRKRDSAGSGVPRVASRRERGSLPYAPMRRAARYPSSSAIGTRSWPIESRSRTVTALSSSESKSTVTQNGVPISSWRR